MAEREFAVNVTARSVRARGQTRCEMVLRCSEPRLQPVSTSTSPSGKGKKLKEAILLPGWTRDSTYRPKDD